jgi:aa3 type cytochrome c oxidase subunit IV
MAAARELTSFGILEQQGEQRGASEPRGYVPDRADFEHHIETYRGFKRVIAITVAHLVVILLGMYFFLVR